MIHEQLKEQILEYAKATSITRVEEIQELWSGYGKIVRVCIEGGLVSSIIVKRIERPVKSNHPRGWDTSASDKRKWKSYEIESCWYQDYSALYKGVARLPELYFINELDATRYFVLEDLNDAGYPKRSQTATPEAIQSCLVWLAHFHAKGLMQEPKGLWEIGTYWHLATRTDEYAAMKDGILKSNAEEIDRLLNDCEFQTLVHGDAKLANFCFSEDFKNVAAVDFQYVGGGCGMKDVAYFLSSCYNAKELRENEEFCLKLYFDELREALSKSNIDLDKLELEWRKLYPVAWADFIRFLVGWSPDHYKLSLYSESQLSQVFAQLKID